MLKLLLNKGRSDKMEGDREHNEEGEKKAKMQHTNSELI